MVVIRDLVAGAERGATCINTSREITEACNCEQIVGNMGYIPTSG